MEIITYNIVQGISGSSYNLPIFLDQTINDLGTMVVFDGNIGQIEQKCNFTYTGNTTTITIFNTVNTNNLPALVDAIFTISWGDNTPDTILPMTQITDINLSYTTHTYMSPGIYTITVTINSPWDINIVNKDVTIPFVNSYGLPTDFGSLTFTIPYSDIEITQQYLEDYTTLTGSTNDATRGVLGVGKSRIDELLIYGSNDQYSGITITPDYTGYTLDNLYYMDYPDGYTHITGTTASFDYQDEQYNGMITRNEYFIGYIEDPIIFSDIYVERGKMGIMERNLRLSEIENTGELQIYGNGYFNIRKQ